MDPITLPFQAIPTAISLFAGGLILLYRKRLLVNSNAKSFWVSALTFFLVYVLIVGAAAFDQVYCQGDLNQYDLEGDGIFGESEQNEGQVAAMNNLIRDTGRNFAVITGGLFAFVIALVALAVSWGFEKYNRLKADESKERTPRNYR